MTRIRGDSHLGTDRRFQENRGARQCAGCYRRRRIAGYPTSGVHRRDEMPNDVGGGSTDGYGKWVAKSRMRKSALFNYCNRGPRSSAAPRAESHCRQTSASEREADKMYDAAKLSAATEANPCGREGHGPRGPHEGRARRVCTEGLGRPTGTG